MGFVAEEESGDNNNNNNADKVDGVTNINNDDFRRNAITNSISLLTENILPKIIDINISERVSQVFCNDDISEESEKQTFNMLASNKSPGLLVSRDDFIGGCTEVLEACDTEDLKSSILSGIVEWCNTSPTGNDDTPANIQQQNLKNAIADLMESPVGITGLTAAFETTTNVAFEQVSNSLFTPEGKEAKSLPMASIITSLKNIVKDMFQCEVDVASLQGDGELPKTSNLYLEQLKGNNVLREAANVALSVAHC